MGMDLITACAWRRVGTDVNFDAGRQAALTLDSDGCQALADQANLWDDLPENAQDDDGNLTTESLDLVRQHAVKLVNQLAEVEDPEIRLRDYTTFRSPDGTWEIWVAGGSSWGDSPGETFDAINDLWACTDVLAAIGFETVFHPEPTS